MSSSPVNVQLTITGRVQGVGFRYSTIQKAREHNITGFVKKCVGYLAYREEEPILNGKNQGPGPTFGSVQGVLYAIPF